MVINKIDRAKEEDTLKDYLMKLWKEALPNAQIIFCFGKDNIVFLSLKSSIISLLREKSTFFIIKKKIYLIEMYAFL
ncbi:MAG: hypothetical protein R2777_08605 [Chitinophagales bacterium]